MQHQTYQIYMIVVFPPQRDFTPQSKADDMGTKHKRLLNSCGRKVRQKKIYEKLSKKKKIIFRCTLLANALILYIDVSAYVSFSAIMLCLYSYVYAANALSLSVIHVINKMLGFIYIYIYIDNIIYVCIGEISECVLRIKKETQFQF